MRMEKTKKEAVKNGQLLSVKNLAVEYTSGKEIVKAVNGVSFDINYGETIGLVGETGAGKTTIAKAILGILPVPPAKVTDGEIYLGDENLLAIPEERMRKIRGKHISMVFQDPMTALNPVKRVGWQIEEGIRLHENLDKNEARVRAMEMLEQVGIKRDRFFEYPHQFSGGMKQRVVIAIALACNPDLLIADEPTSALDVTIQAQVLEMIKSLQKAKRTAMILITHDFGVVAKSCDKVAIVYAGEIVEFGTTRQIFENFQHPYTEGLFNAIPSVSQNLDRLNPIKGLPPDPTHLPKGCKFAPRCPYASAECANPVPNVLVEAGHICKCWRCKAGEVKEKS